MAPQQTKQIIPTQTPDVREPEPVANTGRISAGGSSLVPDIQSMQKDAGGLFTSLLFWVGVTPNCPVEWIDCAGINFPKLNEDVVDKPHEPGKKIKVPVVGAITSITPAKMRRMTERLSRTVIRFRAGQEDVSRPGLEVVDKNPPRGRRGFLITIPSKEEIETAAKAGHTLPPYTPSKYDEPAAKYMYLRLCDDQVKGNRLAEIPETLDVTGLEWPGELLS